MTPDEIAYGTGPDGADDAGRPGWALLRRELWSRRRRFVPVLGWSLLEALPALLSGLLVAAAADQGFLAGRPDIGLAWLGAFAATQLVRTAAVRGLLPRLADVVEPVRDALVTRVVWGALRGAVADPRRPDTGTLARLTEQVQSIRGLLAALLLESRRIAVAAGTAIVGIAALSPVLAGLTLVPVLICVAGYVVLQRRLRARQHTVLVADEAIAADTQQVLDGLPDLVSCGARERAEAALGGAIEDQARAERRLAVAEAGRSAVVAAAEGLPLLAVLAAAPWLVGSGQIGAGAVLGAVTYVLTGLQPALSALLQSLGGYGLQLGVTLDRIAQTAAAGAPSRPGLTPVGFTLRAERLTHAHGPHAEPVVRDLTLTIPEGEHLAIVGPSGVGKSTLVDLLTGVVRPRHGMVVLGTVALPDVDEAHLRRTVALVPQEAYLVPGTLRDNLRYLAPAASDADMERAVARLGMGGLVARLGGYDTPLGTPATALGRAERQLVVLARVYLSAAAVVVLDEATCHLDPATEERVESAFRARPGTLIVVAHRMSSARRADRVLVLDGRTAETGSHDTLMTGSPLYRRLVGHWVGGAATRPHDPPTADPAAETAFADALLAVLPPDWRAGRAVATSSAAEALDHALALCRRTTGRTGIVVAAEGQVPALDTEPAAVILAPEWFDGAASRARVEAARRLREMTRAADVPLVADETRAPCGRSGRWLASTALGIRPDVVVAASGLGGPGLLLAAVIHDGRLGAAPRPRPALPAALAAGTRLLELVKDGMTDDGVLEDVLARGTQIGTRLAGLAAHPDVRAVHGGGLDWTVELRDRPGTPAPGLAAQVRERAARRGVIVEQAGAAVRLLPALDESPERTERACAVLVLAVEEAYLDRTGRAPQRPRPRPRPVPAS